MKYPCELIQDLLPLYEEDLCSPASRAAVEAHLRECPDCQKLRKPIPELTPPQDPAADRAVVRGLKRTRRRWAASLMVVLLVPLLMACWNQYRGNGLCLTNLDEMVTARRFVTALEEARWADAAAMVDFSDDYRSIQEALGKIPAAERNTPFCAVEFGGEIWYTRLPQDCIRDTLEDTVLTALQEGRGEVLFPVAVMDSILSKELEGVFQDEDWFVIWDQVYRRTETPWGNFLCAQNREDDQAYLYTSDLLPEAAYAELQKQLQASDREVLQNVWEAYGHVADMTEEEFCAYMTEKYAAELAAADTTVTSGGLDAIARAYYSDTDIGWDVYYRLNIRQGEKQSVHRIRLAVVDGAIHAPALEQMSQRTEDGRELHKAFYPSAHPDY